MASNETESPVMVTPSYARNHLIKCGKTKFYAMVKAGSIRLVDVGVGRKMVDVASIKALVNQEKQAA
jgi:hypothetical protein